MPCALQEEEESSGSGVWTNCEVLTPPTSRGQAGCTANSSQVSERGLVGGSWPACDWEQADRFPSRLPTRLVAWRGGCDSRYFIPGSHKVQTPGNGALG
jgi:hypothetical protein